MGEAVAELAEVVGRGAGGLDVQDAGQAVSGAPAVAFAGGDGAQVAVPDDQGDPAAGQAGDVPGNLRQPAEPRPPEEPRQGRIDPVPGVDQDRLTRADVSVNLALITDQPIPPAAAPGGMARPGPAPPSTATTACLPPDADAPQNASGRRGSSRARTRCATACLGPGRAAGSAMRRPAASLLGAAPRSGRAARPARTAIVAVAAAGLQRAACLAQGEKFCDRTISSSVTEVIR